MEDHSHSQNPFENLDEETRKNIEEIQLLEQSFQQLLRQKNAFSMEKNETELVLKELEKAKGPLQKIVAGQVIIQTTKEELAADMTSKKELIERRLKSIEEQEIEFTKKLEDLREIVMKQIGPA